MDLSKQELPLNFRANLFKELSTLYPSLTYRQVDTAVRNITVQKYKWLLHLFYDRKLAELDSELFKLGILN